MEQCEWYDDSTFKGGKFNPYYREHIRLIEKKNKRVDGIIAISSLFQKHYNLQHVPTLRMPTILNVSEIKYRTAVDSKNFIRIVFAGSLGKGKEKFSDIIKALKIINAENVKIKLDIYGATRKQLLENLENESNILTDTEDFINIFGRIPQEQVEDKLRNADFSIFSRPIRRSSNAGFPTKLAESMSVGTPVITNNTGDISLYLHNGNNGFIANENSIEALLDIFNRIVNMNSDDLTKMRKQARHTAENSFSYEKYKNGLIELIREAEERII
jgi:glycosyltransferase involved in cell wall biosynthesis